MTPIIKQFLVVSSIYMLPPCASAADSDSVAPETSTNPAFTSMNQDAATPQLMGQWENPFRDSFPE
ncbi:hypothetical protein C7H09_07730 [Marinobacter fuscus]|uniref:Uncharacterized protein n=1 Tax=Marinobacter fuscus TaxID=2109942 RepID=A0A2T1KI66_9GAMM|nr:hypothetical protein [Marinobacter fuscus]PSF09708.1 hypothetical protein C7H09_07730 [Marinobacter fuscus]